jgi:hypothetical protein
MPKWSLGTIVKCQGPLTFHVLGGEVIYRRHQDQIIDAGDPLPSEWEGGGVEVENPAAVPSPAKRKSPSPAKAPSPVSPEVVPIPFEEFSEEEADGYFDALSDDEAPSPNALGRTPRAARPKRLRSSPDRFVPS